MAPPPPKEANNGATAQELRRSPCRDGNGNIAVGKGKQKKGAPARKQLNSSTDNGKGKPKQKETPAGKTEAVKQLRQKVRRINPQGRSKPVKRM